MKGVRKLLRKSENYVDRIVDFNSDDEPTQPKMTVGSGLRRSESHHSIFTVYGGDDVVKLDTSVPLLKTVDGFPCYTHLTFSTMETL